MLELKASLVETTFNLLVSETPARLIQILTESPFPEHAIRGGTLEFISDFLTELPRSTFERSILKYTLELWLQELHQNRHQSAFYLGFVEFFKGN